MDELAHANHIRVVLASLLPVSDYGHTHEGQPLVQTKRRPPAQILELNTWMKRTPLLTATPISTTLRRWSMTREC